MTDEEYLAASLAIERQAHREIDLLSTVQRRALARGGESGIIADAAAGLAKRERNAQQIHAIEAEAAYQQECLEARYYGLPMPERPE